LYDGPDLGKMRFGISNSAAKPRTLRMKQASIGSFFKRSATASDELLRPAKKIKSAPHAPTTPSKKEQKEVAAIKEEDEEDAATPPIPQSPPSPKVKFSNDDGGDTEEDEDLQEQGTKTLTN
jgi:hypothetical protein